MYLLRIKKKLFSVVLVFAMFVGLFVPMNIEAAESVEINILGTSDLHGLLRAHDYATDKATTYGLTKVASIVKEERTKDKDLLLIDCGDATQGNFVSDFRNNEIHPVVQAMNLMKYDAFTLGNHEFNYEFSSLQKIIEKSDATVLGGNIYKADGNRFVEPYVIKEVKGVKVALFGITAPHITRWESDASHYDNMTFTTPMEETGKILKELEGKADVIIGICHYGEDGEYDTEGMYEIAKKYGDKVDAFFIGHSHSTLEKYLVNGEFTDEYTKETSTVLLSTGSLGKNVGKISLTLEKSDDGWNVADRKVDNLATDKATEDEELVKALEAVHTTSVETANTVVGKVGQNFYEDPFFLPGIPNAIIQDGPLLDLINKVQIVNTGADVSLAALFDINSNLQAGDYMKKDGVKVYKYDNTLMAVNITGKQLKAIMEEQAGKFFNQYKDGDVTISFNENIRLYNYDVFAGVKYQIDISKPVGQRIVNLIYKGKPLQDDEKLVLALNNYRYGGLSASGMISADPKDVVYDSAATASVPAVREMISEYVAELDKLMPKCDHNWEIIGYDFDYVGTDKVYEMIRSGEIKIPTSTDGRTSNVKAVNMNELAEQGIITKEEASRIGLVVEEEIEEEQVQEEQVQEEQVQEEQVLEEQVLEEQVLEEQVQEEQVDGQKTNEYIVMKGDCLYRLAKKFECTISDILNLNPKIKNPDLIYINQILIIPD
jgi:2',3'-cyclic-nucleotide 2'-phosphodiesterase (5'-nucleotidase family)/LysM repeat protein